MGLKALVEQQYQAIVDRTAGGGERLQVPPEGWLRTARKALGMSGAQLARRMGASRGLVSQTERGELEGRVTLRTMARMADAMGYQFVYALVPKGSVQEMVQQRALQLARHDVASATTHMALEDQMLDKEQQDQQVQRLARRLMEQRGSLWDPP